MTGTIRGEIILNNNECFIKKCKRKSVEPIYSMCIQPSFIIGTNNDDGSYNFAPITWVSATQGEVLDVPVLEASRWVYECEVVRSVETGDSTTFFCRIRNIQIDERLSPKDIFDIDLTVLDPVIYSGKYHSLGKMLGEIGDFCKDIVQQEVKK